MAAIDWASYAVAARRGQTLSREVTHARLHGSWVIQSLQGHDPRFWPREPGKKKGLHPKMEPIRKWGKRTREEETPFAVGRKPREEGSAQIRCRETARPREEGSVGVSATG